MTNIGIPLKHTIRRLAFITMGAIIMAFNINTFVHAGGLIPGGFTGLTLLIQEIFLRYMDIAVPFSVVLYILNAIPAAFCFKYVGKKFTLFSILMVFLSGLLTDFMPTMLIDVIQFHDILLSVVFGGILNAAAVLLCLHADAASGGTDFIAIYVSEKHRKDSWNYIFAGNCFILIIAGSLFTLDKALYSIIFQFTSTMVLNKLYRAYQQKTLLVVTTQPAEVYSIIRDKTHHGATFFNGIGMYDMKERSLLYSVVYSNEVASVVSAVHAIDPGAFINIIKTEHVNGRFYRKPME